MKKFFPDGTVDKLKGDVSSTMAVSKVDIFMILSPQLQYPYK